jgi:hypothetical protein
LRADNLNQVGAGERGFSTFSTFSAFSAASASRARSNAVRAGYETPALT